ncbi:MAG TPA: DinB family protein [Longimicrobium sp.]|nr:DinB family protein [Longimicrobium sp.]
MTMATPEQATTTGGAAPRFLEMLEREHQTTMKVLRAYPAAQAELRPAEKSKTARELAYVFAAEAMIGVAGLTTGFDFSKTDPPPVPGSMEEVIQAVEDAHRRWVEALRTQTDAQLRETVQFPVAPFTMGDWPKIDFLWMLLHDHIHHRGQFSVYLRMAGGKVPSIYGPSADEPWI